MKRVYKAILIITGVIILSELIHIVPNPPFIQKYIDKLNSETREEIEAAAKFAATSSKNLPPYLNLFGGNPNIKFDETLTFINRSPVSKFTYAGKYEIATFRLDSLYNNSLFSSIKERYVSSKMSMNVRYAIDDLRYITFDYNNSNAMPDMSKDIFLNLDGVNTQIIKKNDTISYYSSNIKNMSIQYNSTGINDVCAKSSAAPGPVEILFLKRNNMLYVVFMTAYSLYDKLNPNLLLDLVTGSNK